MPDKKIDESKLNEEQKQMLERLNKMSKEELIETIFNLERAYSSDKAHHAKYA